MFIPVRRVKKIDKLFRNPYKKTKHQNVNVVDSILICAIANKVVLGLS